MIEILNELTDALNLYHKDNNNEVNITIPIWHFNKLAEELHNLNLYNDIPYMGKGISILSKCGIMINIGISRKEIFTRSILNIDKKTSTINIIKCDHSETDIFPACSQGDYDLICKKCGKIKYPELGWR